MFGVLAVLAGALIVLKSEIIAGATGAQGALAGIAANAGLGIDEVSLTGHRFTVDSDILDCLDLPNVATMTALNTAAVKARIERLPWIATAALTRVYPGRIEVVVTERTPFAVWLTPTNAILVDETGRNLAAVAIADAPNLPRLAGYGAPAAARALFQMLAHAPAVAGRLVLATRIANRRWSLELTQGLRLELPSEGEATALALLSGSGTAHLLAARNTVIDLRSGREIAVRPSGASIGSVR